MRAGTLAPCVFLPLFSIFSIQQVVAQTIAFTCSTNKYKVIIDQPSTTGAYRYRSWNSPKKIDMKPDLEVKAGIEENSGTGPCRHTEWLFKAGNARFEVSNSASCSENEPPNGAIGSLSVYIKEELKSQSWCMK